MLSKYLFKIFTDIVIFNFFLYFCKVKYPVINE